MASMRSNFAAERFLVDRAEDQYTSEDRPMHRRRVPNQPCATRLTSGTLLPSGDTLRGMVDVVII